MFQNWTSFDIALTISLVLCTISLVLCIIGFFGYVNEVIQGRVGRYTPWSELNTVQWIFVVLTFQLPVFVVISLIVRSIA